MDRHSESQRTAPEGEPPTWRDVESAARRLDGVAHRTPVVTSGTADRKSVV